jgi:hypothetical protein
VTSALDEALAKLRETEGRMELEAEFFDLIMGTDKRRHELLSTLAALDEQSYRHLLVRLAGLSADRFEKVAAAAQASLETGGW